MKIGETHWGKKKLNKLQVKILDAGILSKYEELV